jgi:hypothetical protein
MVSTSGYYAWSDRPSSRRAIEDAVWVKRIRTIHADPDATYGMSRVRAELIDHGAKISGKRATTVDPAPRSNDAHPRHAMQSRAPTA